MEPSKGREVSSREGKQEKSHFSNWKRWQGSRWKKWKLVTIRRSHSCEEEEGWNVLKGLEEKFLMWRFEGLPLLMLLNMRSSHLNSSTCEGDELINGSMSSLSKGVARRDVHPFNHIIQTCFIFSSFQVHTSYRKHFWLSSVISRTCIRLSNEAWKFLSFPIKAFDSSCIIQLLLNSNWSHEFAENDRRLVNWLRRSCFANSRRHLMIGSFDNKNLPDNSVN